LQEQQFNRRRAAAMNIGMVQSLSSAPAQATAGCSNEEMRPNGGFVIKAGTQKPPAAVLQVVKQVITLNHIERFTTL
jgi:hypothetical protein